MRKGFPMSTATSYNTPIMICLFLSLMFCNISQAKDIDGEFVVFSVGAHKCSDYIKAKDIGGNSFKSYKDWLSGYMSAFNLIVTNTYDIIGQRKYSQIIRWLDIYCKKNRNESFVNASAMLTVKLYPSRQNLAPNKDTPSKWTKSGKIYTSKTATKDTP